MTKNESTILQGPLDSMVPKTSEQMGSLYGYGIARRIEQVGQDALVADRGTTFPCLSRLGQKKGIGSEWGTCENGRRAEYGFPIEAGREQLPEEEEHWDRITGAMERLLSPATEG